MKKNKIMAIILTGAMTASMMSGAVAQKAHKKNTKNIQEQTLLTKGNQITSKNACVINGNNNLVLTNKDGKIISYISVGEMLKVQSTDGNKSLVTVQETGAKGYINNSNILNINSGDINNVTRMNRSGSIINVSNSVNVRKGPSMNDEIISGLSNNTAVRITGKTGQWYRVSVNGVKGYIFEEYVAQRSGSSPATDNGVNIINTNQSNINTTPVINNNSTKGNQEHNVNNEINNTPNHVSTTVNGGNSINNSNINGGIINNNGQNTKPNETKPVVKPNNNTNNNTHNNADKNANNNTHNNADKNTNNNTHNNANNNDNNNTHNNVNNNINNNSTSTGNVVKPSDHTTGPNTTGPIIKPENNNNTNNTKPSTGENTNNTKPSINGNTSTPVHSGGTTSNGGSDTPSHKHDGAVSGGGQVVKPSTGDNTNHNNTKPSTGDNTNKPVIVAPKLEAHNVQVKVGTAFNKDMISATASQGATITYEGLDAINTNKPTNGTPYKVTVIATKDGVSTKVVVNVSVVDQAPQLIASRQTTLTVGTPFSISLLNAKATSSTGENLTKDIKVISGNIDTSKAHGFENITLAVKDQFGTVTTLVVQLQVKANPNTNTKPENKPDTKPSTGGHGSGTVVNPVLPAPVMEGHNVTIEQGKDFNIGMLGVKATVKGEPVQVTYKGDTINTNKPGTYKVTAIAKNSQGKETEKTYTVTVTAKPEVQKGTVVTQTELPDGQVVPNGKTVVTGDNGERVNVGYPRMEPGYKVGYVTIDGHKISGTPTNIDVQGGKTITVVYHLVKEDFSQPAPVITGNDITIPFNGSFNVGMLNAKATVEGHEIQVTYSGTVNTGKAGKYEITATARNVEGKTTTKTFTVTVQPQKETPVTPDTKPTTPDTKPVTPVAPQKGEATVTYETEDGTVIVPTKIVDIAVVGDTITGDTFRAPEGYHLVSTKVNGKTVQSVEGLKIGKDKTEIIYVVAKDVVYNQPTITGNNITVEYGSNFNISQLGIKVDANGQTPKVTYNGIEAVNTKDAGKVFHITVTAVNGNKQETKTFNVTIGDKPVVKLPAPVVHATGMTLNIGHEFNNSMLGATATEGATLSYSGTVNVNKPGDYVITVTAVNSQGTKSEPVQVTVHVDDVAPTLSVSSYTMTQGGTFNVSDLNVQATSALGQNIANTAKIVSGSVDTNTPGTYNVTVQVQDQFGKTSEAQATVIVKEKVLAAPVISVQQNSITLTQGDTFNASAFGATSTEGCTVNETNNVDMSTPGTYHVTFTATNSQGTKATPVTVTVIVKEKMLPAPVVSVQHSTLELTTGQAFADSMIGASSTENGTLSYKGDVDTSKAGTYTVTVTSTNSQGTVSAPVQVTVTVKAPQADWHWINKSEGILEYKGQTMYTQGSALQQLVNQDAFNLINQYRASMVGKQYTDYNGQTVTFNGGAYKESQAASYMAQWKVNNLAKYHYYAHVAGGTGNPFTGLTTNQVFAPQAPTVNGVTQFGGWCENLTSTGANGNQELYKETGIAAISKEGVMKMAEGAVNAWINSPEHKANLLSSNEYMGVDILDQASTPNGEVVFGGLAVMDAVNPPAPTMEGGHIDPVTWETVGGHLVDHPIGNLTTPDASAAQALAKQTAN